MKCAYCGAGRFRLGVGVRFNNPDRAPLLLIAGEEDKTVDPAMIRATYKKYQRSTAVTAFKSFPGRPHFLIGSPGWEEVADYAIQWASGYAKSKQQGGAVTVEAGGVVD